ncbi:MAG: FAD-dependent oxidoreductase, partial [Alphaproteobacteria bacterium]|nr:FAD-dependent oxidoreductase [Alphaproteobacteria bacterium]
GVDVHAFDPARSLGGLSSSDLQDKAIELMRREFEITMAPASPVRAANGRLEIEAGDMRCTVDAALLAIGRVPNLGVLAVHNAGLTLNDRGALDIDPATMRVKDKPIYVAGDVTGQKPVLHEAVDEGRIAGYNAVRDDDRAFDRRAQLTITFCDPNIAVVGDGFAALEGKGHRIATGKVDYANQGRATVKAEAAGGAEMYLERSSGRLLGAELLAPDGEHLAHFLAMAVSSGLDLSSILASPFYHPVLEEGLRTALKRAADQLDDELTGLELMRCEEPPVGAET